MKIELTERSIDIIGKSVDCAMKEGKISAEEYEIVLRDVNTNHQVPKKEEPKVRICSCTDGLHIPKIDEATLIGRLNRGEDLGWSTHNCNAEDHKKCLEEAEASKDASGYGIIYMGTFPPKENPETTLLKSELKEWKTLALAMSDLIMDENERIRELGHTPLRFKRLEDFIVAVIDRQKRG